MAPWQGEKAIRAAREARSGPREVSPWWAALLIFVVVAAAYLPSLRNGFVWDDDTHLTNHIVLKEDGLRRVWTTADAANYWPIAWTSYWVEHQLWGLNPAGYHAVSMLLHALNAVLLWRVLLRLNVPGALLVGLLFALHPVNVESVAWISQRRNLLSMFFFLGALLSYLRSEDRGRAAPYVAAVVLFLAAMLSKGAAVGLPVVLLLCAWWRRGRVTRNDVLRCLPFFVVAAAMSCMELWFQQRVIGGTVIRDDGLAARIAGAGWAVWFYLFKAIVPLGLSFVYPRWEIDPGDWLTYVPLAALVGLAAVCWRARDRWGRAALFALGCYLAMLAPVLGLVDIYYMRYSLVADHYQYLALPAVLAVLVAGGSRFWARRPYVSRRAVAAAGLLLLALLGGLTWRQTTHYRDVETLFLDTIAKSPTSWMAYTNLGVAAERRDSLPEAKAYLETSLKLNPDNPEALVAIGLVNVRLGRLDDAVAQFERALALRPDYVVAHNDLGLALRGKGQPLWESGRALEARGRAFERERQALEEQGAVEQAKELLLEGQRLTREGSDLARQGKEYFVAAEEHFLRALALDPMYTAVHINLGNLLVAWERFPEAVEEFEAALAIEPKHAGAHNNLAVAYIRWNKPYEASLHLNEAQRLDPQSLDVRKNQVLLNQLTRDEPNERQVPGRMPAEEQRAREGSIPDLRLPGPLLAPPSQTPRTVNP